MSGEKFDEETLNMIMNKIVGGTPTPDTLEMLIDSVTRVVRELTKDHGDEQGGDGHDG